MVLLIGLVSSFKVVGESIQISFAEGIEKYNMEDGHVVFSEKIDDNIVSLIEEKVNLTLYDFEYFDEDIEGTYATVRVYMDRSEVNTPCIMEGEFPKADNEIVLDRLFAKNNDIKIGDTIVLNGRELVMTGTAAFPDYSCLFESNSDSMFDSDAGRDMLLEQINNALDEEGVDLSEDFGEILEKYPDKEIKLTADDLKIAMKANQMKISMGSMMIFMRLFGVIMFVLIMYILSKQIIEKNTTSIAMTKILGFKNGGIHSVFSRQELLRKNVPDGCSNLCSHFDIPAYQD